MRNTVVILLLVVLGLECGLVFRRSVYPWVTKTYPSLIYPEIRSLYSKRMAFNELSVFFTKIAQKKGALYAFEVLKIAPIPPNTDLHLLGHIVGDELYKQKGMSGIIYCSQDFRNACSHSIVVGYFLKYGEAGLPAIAEACRKAPGGKGAYTMCFHGLGHGILAAVNYELPKAVALCGKTATAAYAFREGAECTGGAIMEIISGGFHNKTAWDKANALYLKHDDPLYPCNNKMIPDDSKPLCYDYLTPHLVMLAGGDLSKNPTAETLKKAFSYCQGVSVMQLRSFCYQGFGKEFVVLAHSRDIRSFDEFSQKEIELVHGWCALAPEESGRIDCVNHAVDSLYWGGENAYDPAIRFCSFGQDKEVKNACFGHLISAVNYFVSDPGTMRAFCRNIPSEYISSCRGQ